MGIRRNFIYSGILTTANYIFPLLTFPYVSRVLGVNNFGIYNFFDSVVNYFILFSMMGISVAGIREIASSKGDPGRLGDVFKGILTLNAITTGIAIVVMILATFFVDQLREHSDMMWMGCFKLVFNFLLVEWFYKGLEEFKYITIRSILVRLIYVASVFIFVRDSGDYNIYYLLSVLMFAANSGVNMMHSRKFINWRGSGIRIKPYIKPFFVLGIYILATSLYTTFNTAFLGFARGDTEVGYYSTSTKLYAIFVGLFTAYTGVMMPRMTVLLTEGRQEEFHSKFKLSADILFSLAIPVIIMAELFSNEIIRLISGPGYEGAVTPMRIVLPLILIIGYEQILVIQSLMPMKEDRVITVNSLIGGVAGVVLNFLLVPCLGAVGSAIVWLSCEIIILVLSQICLYSRIKVGFPFKKLMVQVMVNLPLLFLLYIPYRMGLNYIWMLVISTIVTAVYFLIVNLLIFPKGECGVQLRRLLRR